MFIISGALICYPADHRAARLRQAVGDRQGEAEAVAISLLRARPMRMPVRAVRSGAHGIERTIKAREQSPGHPSRTQRRNDNDSQDYWPWRPPPSALRRSPTPALAQNEQFMPVAGLPHRRLRAERRAVRQRRRRLLHPGQRARRRHQRRQDRVRGVRDRLRHRQGRGVLRAPEGQGPDRRRVTSIRCRPASPSR